VVNIDDSDFMIDTIKIYPFYPDSAQSADYNIMHIDHSAGIADETAEPMEGGPFQIADFHIENESVPTGAAHVGPYMELTGDFTGQYMSAMITVNYFYLRGTITKSDLSVFPFEINSGPVTIYADSDCRLTFDPALTDSKNIEIRLNDLMKDDIASTPDVFFLNSLDIRHSAGGITTVNPMSNPDLFTSFKSNMDLTLGEYGCSNGDYLY
jgi:hypothetical protein